MKWQINWAYVGDTELDDLIADGWEPFAVTTVTGAEKVWLRKPEQVVADA